MSREVKRYRALDRNGHPITSVLAADEGEARAEIARQLQLNPGRVPYYRHWVKHGERIEEVAE